MEEQTLLLCNFIFITYHHHHHHHHRHCRLIVHSKNIPISRYGSQIYVSYFEYQYNQPHHGIWGKG